MAAIEANKMNVDQVRRQQRAALDLPPLPPVSTAAATEEERMEAAVTAHSEGS